MMPHAYGKLHELIYSYLVWFCFRCISKELVLMRSSDFEVSVRCCEDVLLRSTVFCDHQVPPTPRSRGVAERRSFWIPQPS